MQSCSSHLCVLLFLTLTFITVPSLALSSVMVKLNQTAVLPCERNCTSSLIWTVTDEPHTIVAQCDQTSCSPHEGFYISHDQYLKGNLSLTIAVADYFKRNTYTCTCDRDFFNTVRLSIEPRILFIHLHPGKNLILDLQMQGRVVVTYRSKDSTDQYGEPVCTVDNDGLHCKPEYMQRVSLSDSNLILEKVTLSDSGVYTVWDKNNSEINLNYYVSVKEPLVDPLTVNLHESVTLPCNVSCSCSAEWTKRSDVDITVARCNQTSCWSAKGYSISRSKYLQGDFSLTITEVDYSMRGWYTCECDDMDINDFHVVIETEISSVHLTPGEDLLMELPFKEPISVNYERSIIVAGEPTDKHICTLEKDSLDCIDAYKQRMSHTLKLGKVNLTDSGVYTIQSKSTQEVFLQYNVSVKGDQPRPDQQYCCLFCCIAVGVLGLIVIGISAVYIRGKCKKSELNGDDQSVSTMRYAPNESNQLME